MDFKIGDRVIVEKTNIPYDCNGKIGTIVEGPWGLTYKWNVVFDDGLKLWCDVKCLVEDNKKQNKIVITHDGKTTTVTLYRENGSKEVATAKCCPEDTFDFNVGAKLAMERLMEKTKKPEPPKYFTGKAVCVRKHIPWWTEGKIYEFVNGTAKDDDGDMRSYQCETAIKNNFNKIFLPIVE